MSPPCPGNWIHFGEWNKRRIGRARLTDECIVGDEHPSAQILGVDLSPIQPVWVPQNIKFMDDDVESDWLKPENFYDPVHARHVTQVIKDLPTMLQRAYP
jgi:hypothetical protein